MSTTDEVLPSQSSQCCHCADLGHFCLCHSSSLGFQDRDTEWMDPGHSIARHLVAESPFHTEILLHDPKHFSVLDTAALDRVDHGE